MLPIKLSNAETKIVDCLLRGLTLKETADELGVVVNTIKFHRTRIYKALDVRDSVGLVLLLWGLNYPRPGAVMRATVASGGLIAGRQNA